MKRSVSMFVVLCASFLVSMNTGAGTFSFDETPGAPQGGGGATNLEIVSHGAGKATFVITNANVNFMGEIPADMKPLMTAEDKSGKGTAKIVSATGKYFEGAKWCWSGVGKNWGSLACAPLVNGGASVEVDFGGVPEKTTTVAFVPHIMLKTDVLLDGMNGWATHAENAQAIIPCSFTGKRDMITPVTIDAGSGTVHIATKAEIEAYAPIYGQKICKR